MTNGFQLVMPLDCGKYAGMTTLEARKAILADLKEGGFLKEIEPLKHEVGTCYRCHSTIEPMVSKQWFVKMEPLAKPAIESVEKGDIKFVPERFTKNYMNWMKYAPSFLLPTYIWAETKPRKATGINARIAGKGLPQKD